jgi:hypothetical protein
MSVWALPCLETLMPNTSRTNSRVDSKSVVQLSNQSKPMIRGAPESSFGFATCSKVRRARSGWRTRRCSLPPWWWPSPQTQRGGKQGEFRRGFLRRHHDPQDLVDQDRTAGDDHEQQQEKHSCRPRGRCRSDGRDRVPRNRTPTVGQISKLRASTRTFEPGSAFGAAELRLTAVLPRSTHLTRRNLRGRTAPPRCPAVPGPDAARCRRSAARRAVPREPGVGAR